jgi:hypothetical protein
MKRLVERGAGLCFQVIVEIAHQHADTPYAFTLLRALRAAKIRVISGLAWALPPRAVGFPTPSVDEMMQKGKYGICRIRHFVRRTVTTSA